MKISWDYMVVWGLSAIGIGFIGHWLGHDPFILSTTSVVMSPVAGISLLAVLEMMKPR